MRNLKHAVPFWSLNCYPKPLAAVILHSKLFGETSGSERTGDSRFRIAGWDGFSPPYRDEIMKSIGFYPMKSGNPSDFIHEILKSIRFFPMKSWNPSLFTQKTLISVGDRREVPSFEDILTNILTNTMVDWNIDQYFVGAKEFHHQAAISTTVFFGVICIMTPKSVGHDWWWIILPLSIWIGEAVLI